MEILIFWLGTSITSLGIEASQELKVYKDAADAGYKINIGKLIEINEPMNLDESAFRPLLIAVPIINIMHVLKRTLEYNENNKYMILDRLKGLEVLEKMSELEQEEYLKKPTGFRAAFIKNEVEKRLSQAASIIIEGENEEGEIFYEDDDIENIRILKATGCATKLTEEEQKQKVIDIYRAIFATIEEYGDIETFEKALRSGEGIEINLISNEENETLEETENISIITQKEELEKLKKELLEETKEDKKNKTRTRK